MLAGNTMAVTATWATTCLLERQNKTGLVEEYGVS
jgi:hypothetical protein